MIFNCYYKPLEIDFTSVPDLEALPEWRIKATVLTLTNHSIYGQLCNWSDIVSVCVSKQYKQQNYIHCLLYLYQSYKAAIIATDIKIYHCLINRQYIRLVFKKKSFMDKDLLLNDIRLNADVRSVIKHYCRLLFL